MWNKSNYITSCASFKKTKPEFKILLWMEPMSQ